MSKIAIVTDSTADIPPELTKRYGIRVVPLTINLGEKSYLDGIDLKHEEMVAYLQEADSLSTTSQPAPSDFQEVYEALIDEGYEAILSIHISEELSGCINGAHMAAESLSDHIPIRVFDSRSATFGLGIIVLRLAQLLESEPSLEEATAFLESVIPNTAVYFLLGSLDNLAKGGRIGKAGYLVGNLLQIKPVLVLQDGVISVHEKLRTRKDERAIRYLVELFKEKQGRLQDPVWALAYNNNALGQALEDQLQSAGWTSSWPSFDIGSVVATHIGLDAVGFVISTKEGEPLDASHD